MNAIRRYGSAALLAATVSTLTFGTASATEGYFSNGFGARQKALAGAGVADSRDATAGALNPAGLTHVYGTEIDFSVSAFAPVRGYSGDPGPGLTPTGAFESGREFFFIPNVAWSSDAYKNSLFDVVGISLVGNGGMNTAFSGNSICGFAGPGPFCGGTAGVNLLQMFMSVAFAKQVAPGISIGVAPILAAQVFEAKGLGLFAAFPGVTTDPTSLVPGGQNDWSFGGGVRAGIEIAPMRNVRIGVSGTTPIWMQKFEQYRGLFANGGEFDIPASIQAGIAVDVTPQLTLMADWRYIWYSGVDAISNPSTNAFNCPGLGFGGIDPTQCFGGTNGPGFGWSDINVVKLAAEYRHSDKLTLRAGYAWNENPVSSRDAHLNILAPGVVQHHITAGFQYDLGGGYHLEMAGMFAPNNTVRGDDLFGPPGNNRVEIEMYQYEVTAGIKYKFGEPDAPLK